MAYTKLSRHIAAPVDAVWTVLADLERHADWMVDVRSIEIISDTKSGVGTVIRAPSELFGLPLLTDIMRITAWEPPRRFAVEHIGQFHGIGEFLLDAVDAGTKFTWIEEFRPPLGALGELAFALIVRQHLVSIWSRSMANVQQLAELIAAA